MNRTASNLLLRSAPATAFALGLPLISLLLPAAAASVAQQQEQTCPPPLVRDPSAVAPSEYLSARAECTDACNAAGYCCTQGDGGCNRVPCTSGCHIAFFSSDLQSCYDECARANDGDLHSCYYKHDRHADVGELGFNPSWESSNGEWGTAKCVGPARCGCPANDWGTANDCGSGACAAGCDLAYEASRRAGFFRGGDAPVDPTLDADGDALLSATESLASYVQSPPATAGEQVKIDEAKDAFLGNAALLATNLTLMSAALDLIDDYETVLGPLFLNDATRGGFPRIAGAGGDDKHIHRAILAVQQAALDEIYHGTLGDFPSYDSRSRGSVVGPCASFLDGRGWQTSRFFPGDIAGSPPDGSAVHLVDVNATMAPCWGRPVAFCKEPSIRPTGLYLVPGGVAVVTLPPALAATPGFKIQVGGSIINNGNKGTHKRMDRITTTFDVTGAVTHVANPLGGGIYLRVPYLADSGVITVNVTGGAVQAPIFRRTSVAATAEEDWTALQGAPGAWADLETNNFLLQVPSAWMRNFDYGHFYALAADWEKAMDGVSELFGIPPELRNNHVLYAMPDLHIKHGAYGIGYPQVNNLVSAGDDGPTGNGNSAHWFLNDPVASETAYHESGHAHLFTKYPGETEAAVNLLLVYVQHVKFGYDLDEAFINSFIRTGLFTIDKAAINWMTTDNFQAGNEMDRSNSEYNQMRYQHRGYGKYADIARQYGWVVLRNFFHEEHLAYNAGNPPGPGDGLADVDDRTLRLSIEAGEDLTPLIHFWGTHPVDKDALRARMEANNLFPSEALRNHLENYAAIVPVNQAAFIQHFDEVWPGKRDCDCCSSPLYGCGWYNVRYTVWDDSMARASVDAVRDIVNQYYEVPSSRPSDQPTPAPAPCFDTKPTTWCANKICPNDNCVETCGNCDAGPPPPPPPPGPVTDSPTPSPNVCLGHGASCSPTVPCCNQCKNGQCKGGRRMRRLERNVDLPPIAGGDNNEGRNLGASYAPFDVSSSGRGGDGRSPIRFDEKGNPHGFDRAAALTDLGRARGRWRARSVRDYDMELERVFFGPEADLGPFQVRIRDGVVVIAEYKNGGGRAVEESVFNDIPTLEGIFDIVGEEANDNVANVITEYTQRGEPKKVFVAYHEGVTEDSGGAMAYYIRNVVPA